MITDRFTLYYFTPRVRITALCSAHSGIRPVGYSYEGESHDFWEAVFILKGRAGVTAGETIYSLTEGQMIFHPPGEFHRLWNEGDGYLRIVIVTFAADRFPIEKHTICSFDSKERIFSAVRKIRKYFKTDGIFVVGIASEDSASFAQKAVGELEAVLLDVLENFLADEREINKEKISDLYSSAVAVMKNNIGVRLSATEIAAACGTSLSTLQKTFCRYTGMGMMKYYEGVRMQHAKMLLNNGLSVKEAAFALGYFDQNYFSTSYKRYFGVPPKKSIPSK